MRDERDVLLPLDDGPTVRDRSFEHDREGLLHALDLALREHDGRSLDLLPLPAMLPEAGIGEIPALDLLAPLVLGGARNLGAPTTLAHMNPPTPWITWAATFWNATLNQNLLHRDTGPAARAIEARVIEWIAPCFGMDGGHMTSGSTLANLTALWAARESRKVRRVVASAAAHLSIRKSAHLLGLELVEIQPRPDGSMDPRRLPSSLRDACLVLTAGTTSVGAVDTLEVGGKAAWTHVDAAWAGPLRLSEKHAGKLAGIEYTDSVSVSAHKLLFQPKESAVVLFRSTSAANEAITFLAEYLDTPNIGVQGSRGAVAVPLLATLLAWGKSGLAERVERCMDHAEYLAAWIESRDDLELYTTPRTGIVVWRSRTGRTAQAIAAALPPGCVSLVSIDGELWLRNVAANPCADPAMLVDVFRATLK